MAIYVQASRTMNGRKVLTGSWNRRRVDYIDGELLIGVKLPRGKLSPRTAQRIQAQLLNLLPKGVTVIEELTPFGRLRVQLPARAKVLTVIARLKRNALVRYAEPHLVRTTGQLVPRIPNEYANLAALGAAQWALLNCRAPFAWSVTTGNSGVLIAIIDSGLSGPGRFPGGVYRWFNESTSDHFYTQDPLGEAAHGGGYRFEGLRFALFSSATPNTTPLFRWFSPNTSDHFYTTDPGGEAAPASGYQREGVLGNIMTVQIAGTVALYRWLHPTTGDHFYTTDPSGEAAPASGYQPEGTVGFVVSVPAKPLSHPELSDENRFTFGWDYVHDDNLPADDFGHGTAVAGIAAAETDNSLEIAGVCWGCSVYAIKVFNSHLTSADADVADAIREAVDTSIARGQRLVINYSGVGASPADTLEDAIAYARDHDCLVVSISGNGSDRSKNPPTVAPVGFPAAYSASYENVIAVGAIDSTNSIASFSNGGPEVNVVAPGVQVVVTLPNYPVVLNPGGVDTGMESGTSFAAPHVSGLAALLLSADRRLTAKRVREIIETTATHMGSGTGRNATFGFGRINCESALELFLGGTIFRWYSAANTDHFYTADATGELAPSLGYTYEGAPFRLFPLNRPGTVPFFRWLNPQLNDHFYTADPQGELAPQLGYHLEGTIGNIATSQTTGTVALHRWLNTGAADHFYTTDPSGELAPSRGYHYEGIAGFVTPL